MKKLDKLFFIKLSGMRLYSSMLLVFVLITSCSDDTEQEYVPQDLLLHYSFDVNDKSTVQNLANDRFHGAIYAGTRNDTGIIDRCFELRETASRIELGGLQDFVNQEITIEAWIKVNNLDSLSTHQIIGDGYSGVKSFKFEINSRKLKFTLDGSTSGKELIIGNYELQNNEWYHVVVTYDGATAKTFVNGELDNSVNKIYPIPKSINRLYIGCTGSSGFGWTNQFSGYIDELKVYGIAKSANDILASYNNSKP